MENQFPPKVTENAAPQTTPPNPPTPPTPPPKRNKVLVVVMITISILGIGIALYISYFVIIAIFGIQSDFGSCDKGRTQLFNNSQTIADGFNAINFVPGIAAKATVEKQNGDCLDSLPTITATREFKTTSTAGEVYDSMTKALVANGYKPEDDYSNLNPCSYEDNVYSYSKGDHKINITIACSTYGAKDDSWRQVPTTKATADLRVTWYYPEK